MTLSDSIVLEFLAKHDLELPPKALSVNLNRHGHDIGYSTVQLRLSNLEENGYVEKSDTGYYEISEKGRRWLNHELDEDDI
ncbi:winged-helix domain-containing protein [Halorubrum tebenquichense]|uniref:Phage PhiH1 repressor protein-like protein n=1 Tax=Halorubrum tebenquichense DSM 14210 TaxID=1227485 RepID=M0DW32_9EURY|nr:winged-helix domain-containing protein [Halorubrum tebenquichense]ELZ38998.1 phage PhiH1 repressor protein-like protein [Halorubrum tebenquichense DSM 14210]